MSTAAAKVRKLAEAARSPELARARLAQLDWEVRSAWWSARAASSRRAWAKAVEERRSPADVFASEGDWRWLWLNTRGYRDEPLLRSLLPGVPDEAMQAQFTGQAGEGALHNAWNLYCFHKQAYARHAASGGLTRSTTVLEYGCGWGRIVRFFLKDLGPGNLWGIDCDPEVLEVCRRTNPWSTFVDVDVMPPSSLPDCHFDLVYAYSVFSHLSEESHDRWLNEFRRILKPDGILIVSTRARSFIETCAWLRSPAGAGAPPSHGVSAGAFVDTARALAAYDAGEYCFSYRTPEDPLHFGETCIPLSYVKKHWAERFHLLEFVEDPRVSVQNFFVLRNRQS